MTEDELLKLQENRRQESIKLEFDWHKHLTTLISGVIVVIVTVVQAFFSGTDSDPINPFENWQLQFSLASLALGLSVALLSMMLSAYNMRG